MVTSSNLLGAWSLKIKSALLNLVTDGKHLKMVYKTLTNDAEKSNLFGEMMTNLRKTNYPSFNDWLKTA